jgi:hypothetical protein
MKLARIAIYATAAVALLFGWLVVDNPNLSSRAGEQVTFLSLSPQSIYGSKVAKKLLVPGAPPEEPEWLIEAQNDPDPKIRLKAIEAWARNPTESLDPITYALADPDASVRARVQKLLEDRLARGESVNR